MTASPSFQPTKANFGKTQKTKQYNPTMVGRRGPIRWAALFPWSSVGQTGRQGNHAVSVLSCGLQQAATDGSSSVLLVIATGGKDKLCLRCPVADIRMVDKGSLAPRDWCARENSPPWGNYALVPFRTELAPIHEISVWGLWGKTRLAPASPAAQAPLDSAPAPPFACVAPSTHQRFGTRCLLRGAVVRCCDSCGGGTVEVLKRRQLWDDFPAVTRS
jgi:hypothetical protein